MPGEEGTISLSNLLKFPPSSAGVRKLISPELEQKNGIVKEESNEAALARQALQEINREKEHIQAELEQLRAERMRLAEELDQMKKEAQAEIEAWREMEEKKLEQLKQEAFSQGYDQGLKEGRQEGLNQYRKKLKEAEEIVQTAYQERMEILRQAEADLLQLSISIARKVVGGALTDPKIWQPYVANGLKQIVEQDEVVICLPAHLYPQLLPYSKEWAQLLEGNLKVIPDSTLNPDQCLIKTPDGTYDLSLDQQLGAINKQLMACFEERIIRDQEAGRVSGRN